MRIAFLTGLFCILLTAGAGVSGGPQDQRGLGGTGHTAGEDGSGIGGTGYAPSGDGRGIGGTGIIGTVNAFGSIVVNGVEVDYREQQPVTIYGRAGTPADLRLGQVVAVEADERSGRLVARSIEVRHSVAGPVTSIDAAAGEMALLGQRVQLPLRDPGRRSIRPGDRVAVSGLRDDRGLVIASRIDAAPADIPAFVRGEIEQADRDGLVIGGRRYAMPVGNGVTLIAGQDVTLYGRPANGGLRVERLQAGPAEPFEGRVRNLLLEGFVGPRGRRVGGIALPAGAYPGITAGERVVVRGRWSARRGFEREGLRIAPAPRPPHRADRGSSASRPWDRPRQDREVPAPVRGPASSGPGTLEAPVRARPSARPQRRALPDSARPGNRPLPGSRQHRRSSPAPRQNGVRGHGRDHR